MDCRKERPSDLSSLSPKRTFQAADGVLYFACGLVGPAFCSALPSARSFVSPLTLPGRFHHSAFACALDSILIRPFSFHCLAIDNTWTVLNCFSSVNLRGLPPKVVRSEARLRG